MIKQMVKISCLLIVDASIFFAIKMVAALLRFKTC